jgi:flagellar protein FlaG
MDIESTLKLTTPATLPSSGVSSVSNAAASASTQTAVSSQNNPVQAVESEASVASQTKEAVKDLQEAVVKMNEYVQAEQRTIHFSIDEDSGKEVVTVLDRTTDEVIRQMPSEEVLVFARRLAEQSGEALSLFSDQA